MAHEFSFPNNLHTAGDFVTTVVNVLESGSDHVHMVVGVCAAADAKTEEVISAETVFTSHGIAVGEDVANFASTHAGFAIEPR